MESKDLKFVIDPRCFDGCCVTSMSDGEAHVLPLPFPQMAGLRIVVAPAGVYRTAQHTGQARRAGVHPPVCPASQDGGPDRHVLLRDGGKLHGKLSCRSGRIYPGRQAADYPAHGILQERKYLPALQTDEGKGVLYGTGKETGNLPP